MLTEEDVLAIGFERCATCGKAIARAQVGVRHANDMRTRPLRDLEGPVYLHVTDAVACHRAVPE